jgi:arylformamidase
VGRILYDISQAVTPSLAVWPGDTAFTSEWLLRLEDGDSCALSTMRCSTHCGTHADAPSHYLEGAADISSVSLASYLGPCRVVEVPPGQPGTALDSKLLDSLDGVERVLLRTTCGADLEVFEEQFRYVGVELARRAVELGIRLVGVDASSVDSCHSKDLATHKELLRGGVAILENLALDGVPEGDYELVALPLKLVGVEASPVRAVLCEL